MRTILLAAVFLTMSFSAFAADDVKPIKILDLSSYSVGAAFTTPTRQGLDMAAKEINSARGILGRPLEFIHIDDTGKPDAAITKLEQIILTEKPVLVTGCNLANIELAISSYAKQNKVLQVSACTNSDDSVWKLGHDYTYRGTGPLIYSFNWMLAERAASKKKMRWGAINHSYAWGQQNLAAYKENLKKFQPEAVWSEEQWTPIGKIDAGSVVNALLRDNVDAVYTSLWGSDLIQFLREAKKRGLTEKALIVGDNIGRPEFMEQMGADLPSGIITNGVLPLQNPVTTSMKEFAQRYKAEFKQDVRYTALQAYLTAYVIKATIEKAQSTDTDAMIKVLSGLKLQDSIYGEITVRDLDNVPTNGIWVGETFIQDDKPILINVEYKDGKNYFPADEKIKEIRK